MSKEDLFALFYTNNASLGGRRMLVLLLWGLLIGAVIFVTYRITYRGVCYNAKFNISNVIILLITTTIMIMISSNIVISMGMVGALSIIRFRTAIKDPHDTVFIFWSVVEGLSIGSQNIKLALISTLFIAMVLVAASMYTKLGTKYLLIVRGDGDLNVERICEILKSTGKGIRVRATNRTDISCEVIVELLVRKKLEEKLLQGVQQEEHVYSVNTVLESGETVG